MNAVEMTIEIIRRHSNYPGGHRVEVSTQDTMYVHGSDTEFKEIICDLEGALGMILPKLDRDVGEMTVGEFSTWVHSQLCGGTEKRYFQSNYMI